MTSTGGTPPNCRTCSHPAAASAVTGRAIGYVNSDLPGRVNNEVCVRKCASVLGYHLVRLVVRTPAEVDDPLTRLINTARGYNAAAVITPSLDHIGGDPGPICMVCDVVTVDPEQTYARAVESSDSA